MKAEEIKSLRRRIIAVVKSNPNKQASVIVAKARDAMGGDATAPSRATVRQEIEKMINEGILVTDNYTADRGTADQKDYRNLSLPSYTLHGKPVTVREMQRSRHNVHDLNLSAIQKRLRRGMSPELALATPKTGAWKLMEVAEQLSALDEDEELIWK